MIKKITALFLAGVLSFSVNVYAQETIEIERVSFSPVERSLTVSGACSGTKNKQQILEQVIDGSDKIMAAAQSTVSDGRFVIEGFLLPDNFPVGEYKINISLAGGANITVDNAFYYGGKTQAMTILNAIDTSTSTTQIDGHINIGHRELGFVDYNIYEKCLSKGRILNDFLDMDLSVNESNLEVKWQSFLEKLSKNTLLTYFSDTTSSAEIKMLVENKEYFNAMGMTETQTYTLLDKDGKNAAYEIMAADSADTLEGSYTIFKKGSLLSYLKRCRYTDVENAFKANTDIISIDYSNYNQLSQSGKNSVLNATKQFIQTSNDLAAIGRRFESEALKVLNNPTSNPGESSGSGGGGGGSYNYGGAVNTGNQPSTDNGFNGYFSDLDTVPWAYEAITALANKGVLSGVGDGLFDPNSNVTRGQFCKMICVCFGIKADGNSQFYDVTPDKWCYEYVINLANAGIISGVGDGLFASDSNITRQDIAVILDRMIEKYGYEIPRLTQTETFADESDIADYAKNAMYRLQCYGILTGYEQKALPRAFATRAEAAALIYRTEVARW